MDLKNDCMKKFLISRDNLIENQFYSTHHNPYIYTHRMRLPWTIEMLQKVDFRSYHITRTVKHLMQSLCAALSADSARKFRLDSSKAYSTHLHIHINEGGLKKLNFLSLFSFF